MDRLLPRLTLGLLLLLTACARPVGTGPDAPSRIEAEATGRPDGTSQDAADDTVVDAGAVLGRALAALPAPPVEQGLSGLLQAVRPLDWTTPAAVEAAWLDVKGVEQLDQQDRRLRQEHLYRLVCRGLIDIRPLVGELDAPFGFRDDVRGRSWARPMLVQVLIDALAALRAERPEATVTLGDLAQPGCGQLAHGTLVRQLTDEPDGPRRATELLNRARLRYGTPTVTELKAATDYVSEAGRFDVPDEPVLVEHRIIAQPDGPPQPTTLRVETRRFRRLPDPTDEDETGMIKLAQRIVRAGTPVRAERVPDWHPEHGSRSLWRQHWVLPSGRDQLVLFATHKVGRRLRPDRVLEARFSRWQARKPGSFPGQRRWIAAASDPETGARRWERWEMMYEAGHVSHLSGRDVDLSYVTKDNADHFAVNLEAIDVPATWRWLELLDEAARAAGTRLDLVLVDRKIKRLLKRELPKRVRRTHIWRKVIRVSSGHDGHHHVRILPSTPREDAAALEVLQARRAAASDGATGGAVSARARAATSP